MPLFRSPTNLSASPELLSRSIHFIFQSHALNYSSLTLPSPKFIVTLLSLVDCWIMGVRQGAQILINQLNSPNTNLHNENTVISITILQLYHINNLVLINEAQ
jgi:hypothetical protein